jgi:hypothetical protein
MMGAMFETWVAQNLLSIDVNRWKEAVQLGKKIWALPLGLLLS